MKYINTYINLAAIVLVLAIFSGCTTSLFQSPKSQIVGTWESDPVVAPYPPDTWSFNSNGTCTLSFHYIPNLPDSTTGGLYSPALRFGHDTTFTNVPYSITGSTTYYLTIDAYASAAGYQSNQFRFIIVTLNSKTMYLESQILYNPVQTGYIQVGLSKQ